MGLEPISLGIKVGYEMNKSSTCLLYAEFGKSRVAHN